MIGSVVHRWVNFDDAGSGLIVVGLVTRCVTLAPRLLVRDFVTPQDSMVLTQLLIFLALVFGFVFQQIGRLQARRDADERAKADRAATMRTAELLAEVTRLRSEKLEAQVHAGHAQILTSLDGVRETTEKAIEVANHANEKIAQTNETVAEAIRVAAAMEPRQTLERTPDTVLTEVKVLAEVPIDPAKPPIVRPGEGA